MREIIRAHPRTSVVLTVLAASLIGVVLFAALFDWDRARPALARMITAKTGREAGIDGHLSVHLFSFTPHATVDGLTLKNPAWAHHEMMFSAKQLSVSVSLGRLLRGQIVVPEIVMVEPVINLERDSAGKASWSLGTESGAPTHNTAPAKIPTIRRLVVRDGQLHVLDAIRKLKFGGSLSASDESGKSNDSAFKIRAKGTLNEKPFTLDANGAALLELTPDTPYAFSSHIVASDIDLKMHVTIEKPFDLSRLNVRFDISGKDLADVFYLTGLALPNTPPYRLKATVKASGNLYHSDDLQGRVGTSDINGTVDVVNSDPRPKFTASLWSNSLNIVDVAPTLGHPVAAADSLSTGEVKSAAANEDSAGKPAAKSPKPREPALEAYLLPDADLQVKRVRGMDADVHFKAASVTVPKIPMRTVNFHLLLEDGVMTLDPLTFVLDRGKFAGRVHIDARQDEPVSDIDMHMDDVDLTQFKTKAMQTAPLSGAMMGRLKLHGVGTSIHKVASNADGSLSVVIPAGEMTSSVAELTGINVVKGLGLLVAKDETKTDIRCSVIDFQAQRGMLDAKTFFVDTTNVLISGKGNIDLKSEALNLEIHGEPKKVRLSRVRSPITVEGSLAHPAVGIDVKKLAAQGAVAAALGVLLTPVAAVLAFVDPGLAKNKDCAAALSDETASSNSGQSQAIASDRTQSLAVSTNP